MRGLSFGTAVALAVYPVLARAEPNAGVTEPTEIEIFYMAPGEIVTLPSGKLGRGYSLGEWMNLVRIDNALHDAQSQLKLIEDIRLQWTNIVGEKNTVITLLQRDKDILAKRSLRLEGKWEKCEEDLISTATGPIWPYILAIIGGAVGIAGVSFAIGMGISK